MRKLIPILLILLMATTVWAGLNIYDNGVKYTYPHCIVETRYQGKEPDFSKWSGNHNHMEIDTDFYTLSITNTVATPMVIIGFDTWLAGKEEIKSNVVLSDPLVIEPGATMTFPNTFYYSKDSDYSVRHFQLYTSDGAHGNHVEYYLVYKRNR